MEDETPRQDIRRLLKTFGIQADETIIAHLARNPGTTPLQLRFSLEDLTDYGLTPSDQPLRFEIEGTIRRA